MLAGEPEPQAEQNFKLKAILHQLEPGLSHSLLQLVAAQQPVMRPGQGSMVTVSRTAILCSGH